MGPDERPAPRRRRGAAADPVHRVHLRESDLLCLLAYLDVIGMDIYGFARMARSLPGDPPGKEDEASGDALVRALAGELARLGKAVGVLAVPYRLAHGLSLREALDAAKAHRQRALSGVPPEGLN
jgi:hypothetical protein